MSESIKKIEPVVAAMAVAALLIAASIAAVPLYNVYATGTGGGDGGDGGEGCTPGFWKNHPEEWPAAYDPDDLFRDVFGVTIAGDPDLTLLQALNLGGGGENALARHAVAALLNAASDEVDFEFTEQEVIDKVQAAIASGDPEEIEDLKDELDRENNRGCPL
jgi:hypothetical protein